MEKTTSLIRKKQYLLNKNFYYCWLDIVEGFRNKRLWITLGWQDIQHRYRRSVLGPIWITLSMSVMIYTLGFIYGGLFKMDLSKYFPHIATGILLWHFIAGMIQEEIDAFIECAHYIKQIKLPFTTYILRVIVRNYVVFAHNVIAIIPLLIYFRIPTQIYLVFLSLTLVGVCAFSYGIVLAMLGARFRDIKPIIQNILQIVFYVTPIMWMPEMLPERYSFVVKINPFHQLIELIRAPLLGRFPSGYSLVASLIITALGIIMMFWLFRRARHRIAFWV